jgi:hypothetical protein
MTGALSAFALYSAPYARAEKKISHEEAKYQDTPKDIRMCATCSLFLPPDACKVVEGKVSPSGWCKLFELAD